MPHELGRGRLERGIPDGRPQKVLRIDATGASPTLIGRLLVGSYITGQDQVLVGARGGLTALQRAEIHRVVNRLLGMSVVVEGPEGLEVENFVDPSKYEFPRLLHRVVELLRDEIELCRAAVVDGNARPLVRLEAAEEEVDQLYLFMARQLLLSSDSPRVAREIQVESHHYQIGDRLVVKVLEVIGDLLHEIGTNLRGNLGGLRRMPPSLTRELVDRLRLLKEELSRTMEAFATLSVSEANETLNRLAEELPRYGDFGLRIPRTVSDHRTAGAAQRIACHLVMVLEMLVTVNEVTINRGVEPETVALTGTRVVLRAPAAAHPPRVSRPVTVPP